MRVQEWIFDVQTKSHRIAMNVSSVRSDEWTLQLGVTLSFMKFSNFYASLYLYLRATATWYTAAFQRCWHLAIRARHRWPRKKRSAVGCESHDDINVNVPCHPAESFNWSNEQDVADGIDRMFRSRLTSWPLSLPLYATQMVARIPLTVCSLIFGLK